MHSAFQSGNKQQRNKMKRRDFIKLGATTFVCGNVTASYADDKQKEDTAVLFLFLGGGASHIETFNPIPLAPADRRSVTGDIRTNVAGIEPLEFSSYGILVKSIDLIFFRNSLIVLIIIYYFPSI